MQVLSWGNPHGPGQLLHPHPPPGSAQPQNLYPIHVLVFSSWIKHPVSLFSTGPKINSYISTTGCSIFSGTPSCLPCPWCCTSKPTQRCETLQTKPNRGQAWQWAKRHIPHASSVVAGDPPSLRALGHEHPPIRVTHRPANPLESPPPQHSQHMNIPTLHFQAKSHKAPLTAQACAGVTAG